MLICQGFIVSGRKLGFSSKSVWFQNLWSFYYTTPWLHNQVYLETHFFFLLESFWTCCLLCHEYSAWYQLFACPVLAKMLLLLGPTTWLNWVSVSISSGFPDGSDGKRIHLPMQIWVQSLGWEYPFEEEMATHSSILAWEIQRSLVGYIPWGAIEAHTSEQLSFLLFKY